MFDYEKMYLALSEKVTEAIGLLDRAHQQCEEMRFPDDMPLAIPHVYPLAALSERHSEFDALVKQGKRVAFTDDGVTGMVMISMEEYHRYEEFLYERRGK